MRSRLPALLFVVLGSAVVAVAATGSGLIGPRNAADGLERSGIAAVIGGGAGVVLLAGELPGPTGLAAVGLASGAVVTLAILLIRDRA